MSVNSYESKYLKYKNKYLSLKEEMQMKGGLLGNIETKRLTELKTKGEMPQQVKDYVKLMTIPDTEVQRVGSSVFKIQPYFSDVDVMNIVDKPNNSSEEVLTLFIQNIKKIVSELTKSKDNFFSDFKAGGIHWSPEEIEKEKNVCITLREACKLKDVIKIDMIVPYNERYVEMSTFFVLKSKDGFINIESDYFSSLTKSLLADIKEYKTTKPFKAIKRVWSLSRINNDLETMDKLKDLVRSNVALMAQINADVETIQLLIEHDSNYNLEFIINEFNEFKGRLSTILDIEYDEEKADIIINNLILLFKFNTKNIEDKNTILESLEQLHDYLLEIINKETNEYLKHIGYEFPSESNKNGFLNLLGL